MSTFGVIVSTRGFFPGELALDARKIVVNRLRTLNHEVIIIPESETKFGAVAEYSDAVICANLFKAHREEIDGVIVVLPNFGDELAVSTTLDLAKLDVPVLIVASDDDVDKMDLAHRRDSFCGKLSLAANLYQYGIKYTNTHTHTLPLDSDMFDKEVDYFSRVCNVVGGLKGARIGAIGARPDAFRTVRYSEKLLQRSGITVSVSDMSTMIAAAQALDNDDNRVQEKAKAMCGYGTMNEDFTDSKLLLNAKLGVALDDWLAENDCDAFAFQCWDSIENNYGCAPCLNMSMLSESGIPAACEMDVVGAVTMLAMKLAVGSPSAYLDWNNSYTDDRDKCVCLHCSNFPKSFMGGEPEIGSLDVLSTTIQKDLCFGACKGRIAAGDFTFAKVSTDDVNGEVKFYAGEGRFTDDPMWTPGGFGVCEVPGLQKLMDYMVKNGFEHHVCMGRGKYAEVLEEALCNYLGWKGYIHEA